MSSEGEQPTLDAFDTVRPHERRLADEGARYGTRGSESTDAPQRRPERVCLNCGADISKRVARVVGDNDDCVPACEQCRGDVLSQDQMDSQEYQDTLRLNLYLLNEKRGITVDNSAGGRR